MKQKTLAIIGTAGLLVLMLAVAGVYAINSNERSFNMMDENFPGMMGNIDQETYRQMDEYHDQMIKNLDPETARQINIMHENCPMRTR